MDRRVRVTPGAMLFLITSMKIFDIILSKIITLLRSEKGRGGKEKAAAVEAEARGVRTKITEIKEYPCCDVITVK